MPDFGNKAVIGGISRSFYKELARHYGKDEAWTFEPGVAERLEAKHKGALASRKIEYADSDDPIEIVTDKVKRAYQATGEPVIVEDVSAGLVDLQGLPGPFIKFFIKRLGQDALYQLAGKKDGAKAVVSCVVAYYDGKDLITAAGEVPGTVVAPRGESFGFDVTFVPDGQTQTYGEMERAVAQLLLRHARANGSTP